MYWLPNKGHNICGNSFLTHCYKLFLNNRCGIDAYQLLSWKCLAEKSTLCFQMRFYMVHIIPNTPLPAEENFNIASIQLIPFRKETRNHHFCMNTVKKMLNGHPLAIKQSNKEGKNSRLKKFSHISQCPFQQDREPKNISDAGCSCRVSEP